MCDLRRKLLSLGNHFFERLKTANFSTACGTSTLKSPPSRGSDASHVHPRPRKRPPRCTLDCGFKTSESPALRGFVAERGPIRGTSLYLVLKSNGLHHSENLPVKFGFSPQIVPANIVKKLPSQRCFKSLFNSSHKRPTFVFTGESGYTLAFRRKIAHSGSHAETGGHFRWGRYLYPRSVPHVHKHPRAGYQNDVLCRFWVLSGCALEERRRPSGQRCAYACRCPEASRPRCVILVRMLIALLVGSVANFPALWYDKFNKLEFAMRGINYVGRKPVPFF